MSPYSFKNGWDMSNISMVPNAGDYKQAAIAARQIIRQRTLNGNDINGKPFVSYSKATVEIRSSIGKKTDIVNLEDTNAMLGSLTTDSNNEGATVGLSNANAAEYGIHHQTGAGVPKREWFGLSQIDGEKISADISKRVIQRNEKRGSK